MYDRSGNLLEFVPDLLSRLPRRLWGWGYSFQGNGMGADGVPHDSDFAHHTGGYDRAVRYRDSETRTSWRVRASSQDRPMDLSDVAVRLGDRRDRLLDALSRLSDSITPFWRERSRFLLVTQGTWDFGQLSLAVSVDNPSHAGVTTCELQGYSVARKDGDEVIPHLIRYGREYLKTLRRAN